MHLLSSELYDKKTDFCSLNTAMILGMRLSVKHYQMKFVNIHQMILSTCKSCDMNLCTTSDSAPKMPKFAVANTFKLQKKHPYAHVVINA